MLNIFNPPEQGPELMAEMMAMITLEAKGMTIIGRDLNLIMDHGSWTVNIL